MYPLVLSHSVHHTAMEMKWQLFLDNYANSQGVTVAGKLICWVINKWSKDKNGFWPLCHLL